MTGIKRPTSFDIAALAGVSQASVSRALSKSHTVSEDVRRKVFEAAAQLNYKVDVNARKLRSRRIDTIAVLVSEDFETPDNPINPFFLPLMGSIAKYAGDQGMDVLISYQKQSNDWSADYGFSRRADGIIFLGYNDYEAYRAKTAALNDIGAPWVVFGPGHADPAQPSIGSDNQGGARAAVAHLISLGRRRIVFLGEASERHQEFADRFAGYQKAHTEAGLTPDKRLAIDCFISREEGAAAVERLISETVDFDAVFAATDILAMGAMQALQSAGRRVPEDVAVMGFDDIWAAACVHPGLSTVRQDTLKAAQGLVDGLMGLIEGAAPRHVLIPTSLIIRQSCGANI